MLKGKRIGAILLALVMVAAGLVGCGKKADETGTTGTSGDVIKIGVFEPITGANAGGGALEVEGIELANKLRPEVLGKKVVLVTVDNKSDKVEAATAASRLVDQEKVNAVIGSWGSSLSIAGGSVFAEAKIPAVGASCTNPLVTQGNDWYFRVCFIDEYQSTVMAKYAANELGAKTAAIISEVSNDYSVALSQFFQRDFEALGGTIVATSEYNTGDQDFNAQLTNVSRENPDVIFAPGNFTESALIISQARQLGIETPFLGTDTWETPEFLSVGGDAVTGAVFSTFFDSSVDLTAKTQVFVEAYKAEHGGAEPAAVTALSFDAYNLILDKIEEIGSTDGEKLRDAIAATSGWEGATGVVTLNENGDATKGAVLKTVEDGAFKFITTVAAE